jgi:acyl homoserine lactone synthase
MIEVVTLGTAHLFGDALASQARLRYRMFVACRNIEHAHFDGMEYDRFDTPAAVYLLWRDAVGETRCMARLLRTTEPYMVKSFWPHLADEEDLPSSPDVWEGTRLCADIALDRRTRQRALAELLCGVTEYLEMQGAKKLIGVTSRPQAMRLFPHDLEWLGEDAVIEGRMESAFRIPVESIAPQGARERYGFGRNVLCLEGRPPERIDGMWAA